MAIDAHVAEIRDDDSVGFHHPAFREVVYAELLPGERGRLHRAAAEALTLETDPPPEVAGEVARHWHLAGDLERALEASVAAAVPTSRCTRSATPTRASAWPSSCWTGCRLGRPGRHRQARGVVRERGGRQRRRGPAPRGRPDPRRGDTDPGPAAGAARVGPVRGRGRGRVPGRVPVGDGAAARGRREPAGRPCVRRVRHARRRLVLAGRRRRGRHPRAADLPAGRRPPRGGSHPQRPGHRLGHAWRPGPGDRPAARGARASPARSRTPTTSAWPTSTSATSSASPVDWTTASPSATGGSAS